MADAIENSRILQLTKTKSWKIQIFNYTIILIRGGITIFGLKSYSKSVLLSAAWTCCWLLELLIVTYCAFRTDMTKDSFSLGNLMAWILFLTQILAHLTILLNSMMLRQYDDLIELKFYEIIKSLNGNLKYSAVAEEEAWHIALLVNAIVLTITICHIIACWTTFYIQPNMSLQLYWYAFPSTIALQVKILQIILTITAINWKIVAVRRNINALGELNLQRVFKIPITEGKNKLNVFFVLPQHEEEDDERQVAILKNTYSQIHALFQLFNKCFGWSLLAFAIVYFIDFVSNSYWIIVALITQGRDNYAFLQNGIFLLITVMFLSVLCWKCQKSYDHGRYIGCMIFKLVKPLGNKRYNDLVTEFSLQTLHQRFVITAKEFFNLNLNLLGSMVAAIVTYLVILIQFMFTEKTTSPQTSLATLIPMNATTATTTVTLN